MEPVACVRDFCEAGFGKEVADFGAVFGQDVGGVCAAQEECEVRIGAAQIGEAEDFGHVLFECVQIVEPAFVRHVDRLGEEGAQGRVVHAGFESVCGIGAAGDLAEINAAHGVDEMLLAVAIGDGRDVGDEDTVDAGRFCEGEGHCRLAAHGMTDHIGGAAVGCDEL